MEEEANLDGIYYNVTKEDCDSEEIRGYKGTVDCTCGETRFWVNFIPAPYTGCFLKITCPTCGKDRVLLDDFS